MKKLGANNIIDTLPGEFFNDEYCIGLEEMLKTTETQS